MLQKPTCEFRYREAEDDERKPFTYKPREYMDMDDIYYVLQQKWVDIKTGEIEWRDIDEK